VEKQFTVRAKTRKEIIVERNMRARYQLGELDASLTHGKRTIISILLANDQPQPWERQWPPDKG
jgi:hypothetical protein